MTSRNLESFVAEMCFKWLLGTIIWAAGKLWPSYPSPDKGLDIRRLSFPTLASVRLTWHVTLFELVVSYHWQLFICSGRSIACFWRNAPNIWKKHDTLWLLWTFHKNLSAIKTDAMQLSYLCSSVGMAGTTRPDSESFANQQPCVVDSLIYIADYVTMFVKFCYYLILRMHPNTLQSLFISFFFRFFL